MDGADDGYRNDLHKFTGKILHAKGEIKKERITRSFFCEATMGFEPMMRVLQTLALPLGDVARYLNW